MPFKSRAQHIYLRLHAPSVADKWEAEERARTRERRPKLRRPHPPRTRPKV